ncbi:uncharacterized protein JCM6883_003765 [Sporobolomyces salmoneus]|uniref:uncharacterized protein n=1 Tax=Sporobolomyces salmoneus TaxID=183962 RepID=UPI00317C8724
MVYYVCPNCSERSDDYQSSMVHYADCKIMRVRQGLGTPPGSYMGVSSTPVKETGGLASSGGAERNVNEQKSSTSPSPSPGQLKPANEEAGTKDVVNAPKEDP